MSNVLRGTIVNPDVIRGKSAYEVAVANGFEGTETEWLESLKGKDGAQGIQGIQGEKGDPGKTVQTNYTQNDSTKPDYIKNKPFYDDFESLGGKLEWDRTPTVVHVDALDGVWYKVSDNTPTKENLLGGRMICLRPESVRVELTDDVLNDDVADVLVIADAAIVVYADNAVSNGLTFPEKGIYFLYRSDSDLTWILQTSNYTFTKGGFKKLDSKFLPAWNDIPDKPFGDESVTIEWDGDTEGIHSFEWNGGIFAKVSELTPEPSELIGGSFSVISPSGLGTVSITEDIMADQRAEGAPILMINAGAWFLCVIYEPFEADVIAEAGIYFTKVASNIYISSLTYGSIKKLDPKYLPEGIGYEETYTGEITIEWDGDSTGKPTVDAGDEMTLVKISDNTPEKSDLLNGQWVVNGESATVTEDMIYDGRAEGVAALSVSNSIYICFDAVSELGVSEAGTWVTSEVITSLTFIYTSTQTEVHKIDKKFLPDGDATYAEQITKNSTDIQSLGEKVNELETAVEGGGIAATSRMVKNHLYSVSGETVTGDGSKAVLNTWDYFTFTEGHIYYARCTISVDSDSELLIRWGTNVGTHGFTTISAEANKIYPVSLCFSAPSAVSWSWNTVFASAEEANGKTVVFDKFVLFDLTEEFGSGYEPPAVNMDALVNITDVTTEYVNLLNAGVVGDVCARRLRGTTESLYSDDQNGVPYVETTDEGNIKISSVPNAMWDKWDDTRYSYGMTKKRYLPIYNHVHGVLETDAMFSVQALYGRWTAGATNDGVHPYGGHVFEAWNAPRSYRYTVLIGKNAETESCVFTFSPLSGGGGTFGTLRLGSDITGEGLLVGTDYAEMGGDFTVNGKLNVKQRTITSSTAEGTAGEICFDTDYVYVCVATNTWKRFTLETW